MKNKILAMIAAIGAALTVVVIPLAAPASADDGCPGTRYVWSNYYSAGVVAAQLQAYNAGTQALCVNFVSRNQYSGRAKFMSLKVCNDLKASCLTNSGTFRYYAGPITYHFPKYTPLCAWAAVKMYDGYGNLIINTGEFIGTCN